MDRESSQHEESACSLPGGRLLRVEALLSEYEPDARDETSLHFADREHVPCPRAFRESPYDALAIDDLVPDHHARDDRGVQIRLVETLLVTLSQRVLALGDRLVWKLEELC